MSGSSITSSSCSSIGTSENGKRHNETIEEQVDSAMANDDYVGEPIVINPLSLHKIEQRQQRDN